MNRRCRVDFNRAEAPCRVADAWMQAHVSTEHEDDTHRVRDMVAVLVYASKSLLQFASNTGFVYK
jgi:hypothetical protein